MMTIQDKNAFVELLKKDKEAAFEMLKDKGSYYQELTIGEQKYKVFSEAPDELFTKNASPLLPEGYAAFILTDVCCGKKEVVRTDFKNWFFLGDADFQGAKFSGVAGFSGATFTGVADFRGAKFSQYADFQGATFKEFKDSFKC
jgi:hypothetical protein